MSVAPITVRSASPEETSAFAEQGWVLLPGLVPEALAGELLERARSLMGEDADYVAREGIDLPAETVGNAYSSLSKVGQIDARFGAIGAAPELGRLAAQLLPACPAVRFAGDAALTKQPAGGRVSEPTFAHQDQTYLPFDRNSLTVWLALDEVTPEMGPLQFRTGSHALGLLGRGRQERASEWAELVETLPLSPPHHLRPGDATVHHSLTIHQTSANAGDRVRWSWIVGLLHADTRYTGLPVPEFDGLGLQIHQPFDHPEFPVIWSSAEA